MECRDRITKSPSGNEGHGVHVCHKCGWLFPNPHPSARHRRAHKKVCGTIEVKPGKSGDHKTNLGDSDDEHLSDNDSNALINGSEAMEKVEEMVISRRSISGFGSGSNRSTRSEEDFFSDEVADFPNSSSVSDSDDVKESGKKQDFSEDDPVVQRAEENGVADAGGSDTHNNDVPSQYHLSSSTLDSSSNSDSAVREEESSVLGLEEKGSVKGVQDKKSEDIESIKTVNDGITFEAVFVPQKVNEDISEFLPADAAVDVIGNQSDLLDEKRDCSPKDEHINSLENSSQATEDANVNAGNIHVLVIPDPAQEVEYVAKPSENPDKNSKGIIISEALHRVDNFADEVSVERETEKTDSHAIDVDISGLNSVVPEPSENADKNSKGIISEALHQEDNFTEEVSVERETKKTDSHATDVDISGPNSVVVHLDEDIEEAGQGKTATEVQNSLVFTDTNLHSFLDDGDSHTRSISTVKPVDDDSEDDNKDAGMLNALEADSIKEKNLIREGNGDDSTPNLLELEDVMDNKVEADRKYEQMEKRSDFYEPHYLGFLDEIVSGVYTNIARKYDNAFWENFTVEFNRRIEEASASADPPIVFKHFSVVEVVDAGLLLRQKYKDYKGMRNVPNFNLLERCFKKCNRCPSLPKFPTSLSSYKSSTSSRANFSCGGSSHGRSTSKISMTTPQGRNAMKVLTKLFDDDKLTHADFDKAMEYFDICVTKCASFLNVKEESRVRFIKGIQRRDY